MPKKEGKKEKEKANAIGFKNYLLEGMIAWLDVPMHSEQARARNKVVAQIRTVYDEFQAERMKLLDKFGSKDKAGNLEYTDETKAHYKLKEPKKFEKEWLDLKNSIAIFDLLPSNKAAWQIVKRVFLNTKTEMDIATTDFFEEVVTELEKI